MNDYLTLIRIVNSGSLQIMVEVATSPIKDISTWSVSGHRISLEHLISGDHSQIRRSNRFDSAGGVLTHMVVLTEQMVHCASMLAIISSWLICSI